SEAESRRRLAHQYVSNGNRLLDGDDLLGALVWYTEALALEEGQPEREEVHRRRIGLMLQSGPRLLDAWQLPDGVTGVQFSPDGARLAGIQPDGSVRLWDATTGRPLAGPLSHEQPVTALVFSPDSRRLLTISTIGKDP